MVNILDINVIFNVYLNTNKKNKVSLYIMNNVFIYKLIFIKCFLFVFILDKSLISLIINKRF